MAQIEGSDSCVDGLSLAWFFGHGFSFGSMLNALQVINCPGLGRGAVEGEMMRQPGCACKNPASVLGCWIQRLVVSMAAVMPTLGPTLDNVHRRGSLPMEILQAPKLASLGFPRLPQGKSTRSMGRICDIGRTQTTTSLASKYFY